MNRALTLAFFLAAASVGAQSDTAATVFRIGPLQVIHQKRTGSQAVSAQLFLLGGARQITSRNAGIEPLVLRAAQFGSKQYPGAATARALGRTGSSISVDARDDWTVYSLNTIRQEFDSAWAVFADRVVAPTLDYEGVVAARRLMLAELVSAATNPDFLLRQAARPIGYARHPYANDPGGSDASLRALNASGVSAYQRAQFVQSRMLLVVVGNLERATIERLVPPTLGTLPAGDYVWTLPPPVPLGKTSMTIIPRQMATDYIIGIYPGPLANTRDYGPFRLGTGLLGAFLNYNIREKEKLSYAAYSPMYDNAATAGGLYASTTKPERVMEIMLQQMAEVANNGLPTMWIPRFVSQFAIEGLLERETCAGQAGALARAFLVFGDVAQVDAPFQSLKSVSETQLRIVAKRYIPAVQFVFVGDTSRFRNYMRE